MSALPIAYIKYDKLNIWIPYEEERYHYKKHEDQKLLRFQNKIAQLTNGLIEKRYFFGKRVSGHGSCVGLNPLHKLINPADRLQLPQISKLDYSIVESVSPRKPFIILVERELLKTGHITLIKYIQLVLKIRTIFKNLSMNYMLNLSPDIFISESIFFSGF